MASIFQPLVTKAVPPQALRCKLNGQPGWKWKRRDGSWVKAEGAADGKCRYRSPTWWVEWWDASGRRREAVSADRDVAELRRAERELEEQQFKRGLAAFPAADETIESLAAEFRQHLANLGRDPKHFNQTHTQIIGCAKECCWAVVRDAAPDAWVRWVGARRAEGMAPETINHYLRALRSFFRWLVRNGRLSADPLASVRLLPVEAGRKLVRRVLSAEDFARFVRMTRRSPKTWMGLDGPARAALYLTAARTGLRAGVLARLRPADLRLDDPIPHIKTSAEDQKNRRAHLVPVPPDLLKELRRWVRTRPAGELLWPGKWNPKKSAVMVRRDLAAAGIPARTADGCYDFHALRDQCGTDLARAGVPLTTVQQYLGHSTPALTARYYVRHGLADLKAAADRLGSG